MSENCTQKELDGFHDAAESLKLYRRADLAEITRAKKPIESLYVDPLPQEQVLRTIVKPNTTFLVGRKGTGKSTIFQRLQHELRKKNNRTSAYLDIKTLYESSQLDGDLLASLKEEKTALPTQSIEKLLLHRGFLKDVVSEIRNELKKRVEGSLWQSLKENFTGSLVELFEDLDGLLEEADVERFTNILGVKKPERALESSDSEKASINASVGLEFDKVPKASARYEHGNSTDLSSKADAKYTDVLVREFNIKIFITRLKELLLKLGVKQLYILVDDFSELPEDAMKIIVDVLIAPLNNWSDEFIKFKIAAYPGRIYYGAIDKTKSDEIYLDIYDLYGSGDITRMEESAVDFTRRLVEQRIKFFCDADIGKFFDGDLNDLCRYLFFATMANPRNLGWILTYLYESQLIHGRKIGTRSIRDAAKRYYAEKIESYFRIGKFLHETFNERSSIYSLKELLEDIVDRAQTLRSHDSKVMQKIRGRPPTSHFHVAKNLESLLSSLELNFFVTRYFRMKDRSGRDVIIYALNYGLCQNFSIEFGRPRGEREFRLYFVERVFDYTSLLEDYIRSNQEIVCSECGAKYSFEDLSALKFYGMKCKECDKGICKVINLSRKYADELRQVDQELLLPQTELSILQTLYTEKKPLRAAAIAGELDCSYQLVGKRGKALSKLNLVDRSKKEAGKRLFEITPEAMETYFSEGNKDALQAPKD